MYIELHIGKIRIQINQAPYDGISVGRKRVQAENLSVTLRGRQKEFSWVLQKLREIDSKINTEQKKKKRGLSVSVLL